MAKPPLKPAAASAALQPQPKRRVDWDRIQVWFLRLLAVGWLVKGLYAWAVIIGVDQIAERQFETQAITFQAITIYYAIVDVLAAIGLWLLASWGPVVWLIAAVSRIVLGLVFPAATALTAIMGGVIGLCIICFMGLSWMASRRDGA